MASEYRKVVVFKSKRTTLAKKKDLFFMGKQVWFNNQLSEGVVVKFT